MARKAKKTQVRGWPSRSMSGILETSQENVTDALKTTGMGTNEKENLNRIMRTKNDPELTRAKVEEIAAREVERQKALERGG